MVDRYGRVARNVVGEGIEAVTPYAQRAGTALSEAAPGMARFAGAIGLGLMPGNIGQDYSKQFPTKGPMAGQEINPATNRPWSAQELATYNAHNL